MFRQYENPHALEKQLKELKNEYSRALENNAGEETLISLKINIEELEERINFAWQDEYENE